MNSRWRTSSSLRPLPDSVHWWYRDMGTCESVNQWVELTESTNIMIEWIDRCESTDLRMPNIFEFAICEISQFIHIEHVAASARQYNRRRRDDHRHTSQCPCMVLITETTTTSISFNITHQTRIIVASRNAHRLVVNLIRHVGCQWNKRRTKPNDIT